MQSVTLCICSVSFVIFLSEMLPDNIAPGHRNACAPVCHVVHNIEHILGIQPLFCGVLALGAFSIRIRKEVRQNGQVLVCCIRRGFQELCIGETCADIGDIAHQLVDICGIHLAVQVCVTLFADVDHRTGDLVYFPIFGGVGRFQIFCDVCRISRRKQCCRRIVFQGNVCRNVHGFPCRIDQADAHKRCQVKGRAVLCRAVD